MAKQLGGATGKGFLPGQSGNPGGRPPSLKNAVAKECGIEGSRLVELWVLIAFGSDEQVAKKLRVKQRSLKDRMDAAKELADRGYGRPMQAVEVSGPEGSPLEIREIRESLAGKLASLAARIGAGGVATEPHGL